VARANAIISVPVNPEFPSLNLIAAGRAGAPRRGIRRDREDAGEVARNGLAARSRPIRCRTAAGVVEQLRAEAPDPVAEHVHHMVGEVRREPAAEEQLGDSLHIGEHRGGAVGAGLDDPPGPGDRQAGTGR